MVSTTGVEGAVPLSHHGTCPLPLARCNPMMPRVCCRRPEGKPGTPEQERAARCWRASVGSGGSLGREDTTAVLSRVGEGDQGIYQPTSSAELHLIAPQGALVLTDGEKRNGWEIKARSRPGSPGCGSGGCCGLLRGAVSGADRRRGAWSWFAWLADHSSRPGSGDDARRCRRLRRLRRRLVKSSMPFSDQIGQLAARNAHDFINCDAHRDRSIVRRGLA